MNISSKIFPTDGFNSSNLFYNGTEIVLQYSPVDIVIILLSFPINSYVIWLIVTGTGNGLAAEFFSLNHSICEILFCLQSLLSLISQIESFVIAWSFVSALATTGRPLFQCLICVERYLAVVHPVTFLKYKPLRYRLICCAFVWVVTFVSGGIMFMALFSYLDRSFYIFILVYLFLFFLIQLFFCWAVLRALKQSGPGDEGRERNERNASMFFIFIFYMTLMISLFSGTDYTVLFVGVTYIGSALAGLVQPLFFLFRVEKPTFVMKCQSLWIKASAKCINVNLV